MVVRIRPAKNTVPQYYLVVMVYVMTVIQGAKVTEN